jgi:uncharacterized protein
VTKCLFASDLHGHFSRYEKLFAALRHNPPTALFLGGDLFPHGLHSVSDETDDFYHDIVLLGFSALQKELGHRYPQVFIILGNDDSRAHEPALIDAESAGYWTYLHDRKRDFAEHALFGYACIPPSPFLFKDWEKYDVSRFVRPGCVSP